MPDSTPDPAHSESDVPDDTAVAGSRATGGRPSPDGSPTATEDETGTTGTGETDGYVGRVAGDDPGYAGETGAERRAR